MARCCVRPWSMRGDLRRRAFAATARLDFVKLGDCVLMLRSFRFVVMVGDWPDRATRILF